MYFPNQRLQKMSLIKCLKSLFSKTLATVNMLKSLETYTRALPSYRFITLTKIELESVHLTSSDCRWQVFNILAADVICSLCNRKILPHSIQLQISRKQKKLLTFSVHFSNLNQMLNIF